MDRMRPVYSRQHNNPGSPMTPGSPMMSPMPHHSRSGSTGNVKKAHTKAAAQKLAQVMSHQHGDDDDDDDDLSYDYAPSTGMGSIGLAAGRGTRARSPMSVRSSQEQRPLARPAGVGRPSPLYTTAEQPLPVHSAAPNRLSHPNSVEQSQPTHTQVKGRPSHPTNIEQPPSARSVRSYQTNNAEQLPSVRSFRSSTPINMEQSPSTRSTSTGRPNLVKPISVVPASIPITLKTTAPSPLTEIPVEHRRERSLLSVDWDGGNFKDTSSQRSTSALQDELDMLQEENDSLLEKLQLAEERCDEADMRVQQLEKQIAELGEGVTTEACLISRKEAALQKREAALRAASQKHGRIADLAALHMEAEIAREEASSVMEKLHELQAMNQKIMLTQEEKEEVILKRCWLSRYWNLCVHHGIHGEIAESRYNYWSSFAPRPREVILSAGQKAKEENSFTYDDSESIEELPCDQNENSGVLNIECMLLVEKGLRELVSLKVEDAILFAMAQQRHPNSKRPNFPDELKLPTDGMTEAYELSQEETEDVRFKQAWLTYFWRRAKNHGLESDMAEERLMFLINQTDRSPTSQDAVAVERGLVELRKLGIESRLWDESRRLMQDSSN